MINKWPRATVVAASYKDQLAIEIFTHGELAFVHNTAKRLLIELCDIPNTYEFYSKDKVKGECYIISVRHFGGFSSFAPHGHKDIPSAIIFESIPIALKLWGSSAVTHNHPIEKLVEALQKWQRGRLNVSAPSIWSVLAHPIE